MNRGRDCELFADRLDELVGGTLPEAEAAELRRHADACADCATQLAVRRHLARLSRDELEATVPQELVDSVWPAVRARIAAGGPSGAPIRHRRPAPAWTRWVAPGLAAACFALVVACGYLLSEVGGLRERSAALTLRVERQERWLAQLDADVDAGPRARTAALAGTRGWERVLARRDRITVAELRELLAAAPPGLTVIDARRVRELRSELPFGPALPAVEQGLVRTDDGLQAGELLRLLESLEVDPSWSLPVSRVIGRRGGPAAVLQGGL